LNVLHSVNICGEDRLNSTSGGTPQTHVALNKTLSLSRVLAHRSGRNPHRIPKIKSAFRTNPRGTILHRGESPTRGTMVNFLRRFGHELETWWGTSGR
jgi:hypothetical protein